MATPIGPFNVRRSGWIRATPDRVWEEFESLQRMQAWYGTGHVLTRYEPRVGATVETDATDHRSSAAPLVFSGKVLVFDPARELTFEQDWQGHNWRRPTLITIRLTPQSGGTLVELFHHGFDASSDAPGDDLEGFESGWDNHHLVALRAAVEGKTPAP